MNLELFVSFHLSQVIAIKDIIRPPKMDAFNDVYIVYELMDTDLHQIIRSDQQITDDHCQVGHLQNSWGFICCHLIYTFQLLLSAFLVLKNVLGIDTS